MMSGSLSHLSGARAVLKAWRQSSSVSTWLFCRSTGGVAEVVELVEEGRDVGPAEFDLQVVQGFPSVRGIGDRLGRGSIAGENEDATEVVDEFFRDVVGLADELGVRVGDLGKHSADLCRISLKVGIMSFVGVEPAGPAVEWVGIEPAGPAVEEVRWGAGSGSSMSRRDVVSSDVGSSGASGRVVVLVDGAVMKCRRRGYA
mmetsp:Transcript_18242/g.58825  ORF Transcript_18242/g.58825 Transcript_18242/m.58825 type:complete len:201 (+) Transcript_18242:375-977(+)